MTEIDPSPGRALLSLVLRPAAAPIPSSRIPAANRGLAFRCGDDADGSVRAKAASLVDQSSAVPASSQPAMKSAVLLAGAAMVGTAAAHGAVTSAVVMKDAEGAVSSGCATWLGSGLGLRVKVEG